MKRTLIAFAFLLGIGGAFATTIPSLDQTFGYAAGSCSVQRPISNLSPGQTCNTSTTPTSCLVEVSGSPVQAYSTQDACIEANKLYLH